MTLGEDNGGKHMLTGVKARCLLLISAAAIVANAVPVTALAQEQKFQFNIPARSLDSALRAFARTTRQPVLFDSALVLRKRSNAVIGSYEAPDALATLLTGTGLRAMRGARGAWTIEVAAFQAGPAKTVQEEAKRASGPGEEGIPDILVQGRRGGFSLNTGIERTRDDAQPFVVFKQEDIKRSGSTNLEQFLRDYVTSNASVGTAEQGAPGGRQIGLTSIDLRGLGDRETLILVDGRRQSSSSQGNGEFGQPLITNIPLASIERIEVLASSAAGIYGIGATGGVINIILRRDYSGREISLNYADTTDFHNADKRIDLVLGKNLEGGRTKVSLSGSYRKANPLLRKYRAEFLRDNQRYVLGNNPNFFGARPPAGATPNIVNAETDDFGLPLPLQLDDRFGGAVLSSDRLFVPAGYRGLAVDGVAPLLANLGRYNLQLSDAATAFGGGQPLIYGTDQLGGTLAVKREMNTWLRLYGEVAASRYKSESIETLAGGVRFIPADAPNNPFQSEIAVNAPIRGADERIKSKETQFRALGGAIVSLPYGWQADADVSYNRAKFYRAGAFRTLTDASSNAITDGTFDIIQDLSTVSFPFAFDTLLAPDLANGSSVFTATLKLAGPVPVTLPGGRPTLALNLEHNKEKLDDTYEVGGSEGGSGIVVNFNPSRTQTIQSAYGEVRLPVIGAANHVPLVQNLELVIAGRYEHYKGSGTLVNNNCFVSDTGLPPGTTNVIDLCDRDALGLQRNTARSSRFEPTYSAKWTVSRDIAFRGSYATGYLPPRLSNLIPQPGSILVAATDPERGGEQVGTPLFSILGSLPGVRGGNPNVKPERSSTISFGTILTPRFIPGLRFSADYTRIKKRDNYYSPEGLALAGLDPAGQRLFESFLRLFPDRVTRGPASDGFAVGPITSLDLTTVNLAGTTVEAIDFALDYQHNLWGGTISFASSATLNLKLTSQLFPDSPVIDVTGARPLSVTGNQTVFNNISLRWRGIGSLRWSNERVNIGVRARYFGPFDLNYEGLPDIDNGRTSIASQTYFDIFGSYKFGKGFSLQGGVNNVFNKRPPFVDNSYSEYGDPRLANFYLNLTVDF